MAKAFKNIKGVGRDKTSANEKKGIKGLNPLNIRRLEVVHKGIKKPQWSKNCNRRKKWHEGPKPQQMRKIVRGKPKP